LTKTAEIMVVTPHPDDAEFGIAGSVARWVEEGREVVYVACTSGDKGSSDPCADPREIARVRETEQQEAARKLGVREVYFMRYEDQCLEDTPEFRKELVRLIRKYRPYTVATTDPYRRYIWHRDHRITGQVVLDAVFPYARDHLAYPDLWEQGFHPHKVSEVLLWGAENPNYCRDITGTFNLKLEALLCHRSQVSEGGSGPTGWAEKFLRDMAEKMAREENFTLGEAFYRVAVRW